VTGVGRVTQVAVVAAIGRVEADLATRSVDGDRQVQFRVRQRPGCAAPRVAPEAATHPAAALAAVHEVFAQGLPEHPSGEAVDVEMHARDDPVGRDHFRLPLQGVGERRVGGIDGLGQDVGDREGLGRVAAGKREVLGRLDHGLNQGRVLRRSWADQRVLGALHQGRGDLDGGRDQFVSVGRGGRL
jgi:hypothetical protein